jgi:hypothetical protein
VRWVSGGSSRGADGFMALVCVFLYLDCCSVGCLCQGLQGIGVVKSWYCRLVSRW